MKEIRVKNPLMDDEEEVAIVIEGTRDGVAVEERFECLAHPPAGATEELARPGGRLIHYIRLCLKLSEEARFEQLLVDKKFNVQPQTVRDAYYGLLEHYADRPTQASGDSGPGRETNGDSSLDAGDSQELSSVG